jgi:DNA-binding helix-hairpin-helix protein with protein kinase domain
MIVYSSKGERITLADTPFSSGGEGEVRHIISPAHLKGNCVKIYYVQKRSKQLAEKIRFMVDNPPQQIEQQGFKISWAVDTILQNNQFIGFMMPLAFPDSKKLVVLTAPQLSKKLDGTWYKYDRKHGKTSLVNRLKLMSNIAIPIHLLHATGKYVLQDFKPDNVLITHSGQVTICDMDSIQITNGRTMLFCGTAATAGYAPPEYENGGIGKSATVPLAKSWDNFALSVVFYQLLFGLHPYAVTPKMQKDATESNISTNVSDDLFPFGNNAHKIQIVPPLHDKFKILPQQIQDLFKRSFSTNTATRPNAEEWGRNIKDILTSVDTERRQNDYVKCPNGHTYRKKLGKCPYCVVPESSTSLKPTPNVIRKMKIWAWIGLILGIIVLPFGIPFIIASIVLFSKINKYKKIGL